MLFRNILELRVTLDMPMGMVRMVDREVDSRTICEPRWSVGQD
jgi:hypothetical protein